MRFLADESCDFAVVRTLRSAGHDVLAIAEVPHELAIKKFSNKREMKSASYSPRTPISANLYTRKAWAARALSSFDFPQLRAERWLKQRLMLQIA